MADDEHFGFTISGALTDYFRVPAAWLHKIPAACDDTIGALVEPFAVAFAATSGIDASDDVIVFGAGPIGLCSVAAAVGRGGRVIVAEPERVSTGGRQAAWRLRNSRSDRRSLCEPSERSH